MSRSRRAGATEADDPQGQLREAHVKYAGALGEWVKVCVVPSLYEAITAKDPTSSTAWTLNPESAEVFRDQLDVWWVIQTVFGTFVQTTGEEQGQPTKAFVEWYNAMNSIQEIRGNDQFGPAFESFATNLVSAMRQDFLNTAIDSNGDAINLTKSIKTQVNAIETALKAVTEVPERMVPLYKCMILLCGFASQKKTPFYTTRPSRKYGNVTFKPDKKMTERVSRMVEREREVGESDTARSAEPTRAAGGSGGSGGRGGRRVSFGEDEVFEFDVEAMDETGVDNSMYQRDPNVRFTKAESEAIRSAPFVGNIPQVEVTTAGAATIPTYQWQNSQHLTLTGTLHKAEALWVALGAEWPQMWQSDEFKALNMSGFDPVGTLSSKQFFDDFNALIQTELKNRYNIYDWMFPEMRAVITAHAAALTGPQAVFVQVYQYFLTRIPEGASTLMTDGKRYTGYPILINVDPTVNTVHVKPADPYESMNLERLYMGLGGTMFDYIDDKGLYWGQGTIISQVLFAYLRSKFKKEELSGKTALLLPAFLERIENNAKISGTEDQIGVYKDMIDVFSNGIRKLLKKDANLSVISFSMCSWWLMSDFHTMLVMLQFPAVTPTTARAMETIIFGENGSYPDSGMTVGALTDAIQNIANERIMNGPTTVAKELLKDLYQVYLAQRTEKDYVLSPYKDENWMNIRIYLQ